ncbi:EAL domain-containing protein [Nakamurella deserti]|uniref:sensor domain-containing phosphodiesterase n=1 Tax=Nakamurella deserti TaxID=2164074 RepID=UPI001300B30C|nr:EAL domain-containing protein [Nakamurella deserti]
MTETSRRQTRSARHYLDASAHASSLETTVMIAARTLRFPVAMVTIVDEHELHVISAVGVPAGSVLPRAQTICDAIVRSGGPVVTADAVHDDRFAHVPHVDSGDVGTYIGVPLTGRESMIIGSLCVLDPRSHPVAPDDVNRLADFGRIVEDQLDLMRRLHEQRLQPGVVGAEIADAIRGGAIVPWYQPVIELGNGRLIGFEALARWDHPTLGWLDPNTFVPFAEDSDLIVELDHSIMRQALTDLARWTGRVPDLRMGVNMSSRQFDRPDWRDTVRATLAGTGASASSVDLELTETVRLAAHHSDGAFVRELQALGFTVWMDDFGTGWSSLEYLLRLPVDGIKIDRVMAVALGTPVGNAVTRAVTGMAADLGLAVTIEGVATVEQAALAEQLGCRSAQGYLWSRPVPASEVETSWLDRGRTGG